MNMEMSAHASRRISINCRSLTGELLGQEFESSLERDLILLMAWEDDIDYLRAQPVKIHFKDENNRPRSYTPDLLVHFLSTTENVPARKPLLCEVKYTEDLFKNWPELKPKFKAARAYAREQDWQFRIFTEKRIRNVRLKNIKYLWSFRQSSVDEAYRDCLIDMLKKTGPIAINELIAACYPSQNRYAQGEAQSTLWCLLANKTILCDMNMPLSLRALVWLDE